MAKQILVTDEGLKKLQSDLEFLKTVKRKECVEAIRVALSFGDLSENSEYDEAKNEQAKVESEIASLEEMLKNVSVIDETDIRADIVNVGMKVKVYDEEFAEEVEYTVVGPTETNMSENKISDQSPIGSALMGGKEGDLVTVQAPSGEIKLLIKEISKA